MTENPVYFAKFADGAYYCVTCGTPEGQRHGIWCPGYEWETTHIDDGSIETMSVDDIPWEVQEDDVPETDYSRFCCKHCHHGSDPRMDYHNTPCHSCADEKVDFMRGAINYADYPEPKFPTVPDEENQVHPRKEVLLEAAELITGDRNNTYGPPTQDFKRSADAMSALGFGKLDASTGKFKPLAPSDIATLVIVIKLSRLQHSPKKDNYVDLAGYAGCGYECSLEEQDETK
jgi:hypothetical protein